jgi:activator of HSP90 ATPase
MNEMGATSMEFDGNQKGNFLSFAVSNSVMTNMTNAPGQTNWKNVNNWHWVEKNCLPWATDYLKTSLPGLQAESSSIGKVAVTAVSNVSGDVDLNQRKGRLLSIFDLELKLEWKGTHVDGTEAKGTLAIPEFMHDSTEIEADVSVEGGNPQKDALKRLVRTELKKIIQTALIANFAKDLVECAFLLLCDGSFKV